MDYINKYPARGPDAEYYFDFTKPIQSYIRATAKELEEIGLSDLIKEFFKRASQQMYNMLNII